MTRVEYTLRLAALFVVLTAAPAMAQQTQQASPTPPATISAKSSGTSKASSPSDKVERTWEQTKAMTRKEWNAAKRKWAMERVKWRECNRRADAEKLAAPKSWSFIAGCMTGS